MEDEFYDIIKHVFHFEKIEIIHENPDNLNYSYNIVKNNKTKRINFAFNKNNVFVYYFINNVYKYSNYENDKKIKKKIYELISLTLKLNILINPDISTQINKMDNMNIDDNNMMNQMNDDNVMNQMNLDDTGLYNPIFKMKNQMIMEKKKYNIFNYIHMIDNIIEKMMDNTNMMMNHKNWCDQIQTFDDSDDFIRDRITEMIKINKIISIDGTGKNKLLKKLISLCEIYGQIFPTRNFQLSFIFSIFLNKKNKILYIINMLNGITTLSELKTNIFIDLLNPKQFFFNSNNILDEEYLLDLAKKNSPEYFVLSVNNYIKKIELGYKIFDSEYSKKKNKLNDLLNQFQSKYFNQLKQKEFNSNIETLIKLIKVINNNESLKNSLLECKKNIKLNDKNNYMYMDMTNKFLIENKDEINIYKEKFRSNVYINKLGDLIYKMQSLYIYEINSKSLFDLRYEIIQLLIQLYFKINSIFYYFDNYYYNNFNCFIYGFDFIKNQIKLVDIRFRILNGNIVNDYEFIENNKNCPKKVKDMLNKVVLDLQREKFSMNEDSNKPGFYHHETDNNKYYNFINQLIQYSPMRDNEIIDNNDFYEMIIFIYELNEKKNSTSTDDKENYNSFKIIKNIINIVRFYYQIPRKYKEEINLNNLFDFSNEIFDIMNILGYKTTEPKLQYIISNSIFKFNNYCNIPICENSSNLPNINAFEYSQKSFLEFLKENLEGYKTTKFSDLNTFCNSNIYINNFEYLLRLAQINTPEYLKSSIDKFILKIEKTCKNITNLESTLCKEDIYKLLNKIESLFSNEQKKKIFEKNMEKLEKLLTSMKENRKKN